MKRRLPTAVAAALLLAAAAPALAQGYEVETFDGGWEEPPSYAVTVIGKRIDERVATVALPFEFPFFGRRYRGTPAITVSTNGWLSFDTLTTPVSTNVALPDPAEPNGMVAAVWDDLATSRAGGVWTWTDGAKPNRVFVVAWHRMTSFVSGTDVDVSFAVRLHEGTGVVEVVRATGGRWGGVSYTTGIEDPEGAFALDEDGNPVEGDRTVALAHDVRFTPVATTLTGRLLFVPPTAGAQSPAPGPVPMAGVDVQLARADTDERADTTHADEDGRFSLTAVGATPGTLFHLVVFAQSEELRVPDAAGTVPGIAYLNAVAAGQTDAGTRTVTAADDAGVPTLRRALLLHDLVRRGLRRAKDAAAAVESAREIPQLDVVFTAGAAAEGGRTAYLPATDTAGPRLVVSDSAAESDVFDTDVVLRETGHHVLVSLTATDLPPAPRAWATASTRAGAFFEGFAYVFAAALQGRTRFTDSKNAPAASVVLDLEAATPAPAKGADVAGAVAASLFDLVDPANEAHDLFDGTANPPPATFDELLRAAAAADFEAAPDVAAFFAALPDGFPSGVERRREASRVLIHHGAFPDDALEPNDEIDAPSAAASARLTGLTLSPFNADRFAFEHPGGTALRVEAAHSSNSPFTLAVTPPFGLGESATSDTGEASVTVSPAPAGTWTVTVSRAAGAATTYEWARSAPVTLSVDPPSSWTAGRPYAVQVRAQGGVAPYAFSTEDSVPGLTLGSGGRFAGTPTAPGDYVVTIEARDDVGTVADASRDFELRINAPPDLPAFFGVLANAPAAEAIGRGGTDTVWSKDADPARLAPLALGTGASLVLSGADSGAPRAFVVGAKAEDAAGARIPSGDGQAFARSTVVVCAPLPSDGPAAVPEGSSTFGYAVEAQASARIDLRLRFSGRSGKTPTLAALIGRDGSPLSGQRVQVRGRSLRVRSVGPAEAGRLFVLLSQDAKRPFAGTVRGRLLAPEPR